MNQESKMNPTSLQLLNSWKEISAYIGRAERTAQRWERQFGLPVHRPANKDKSAVVAIPKEIDDWIRTRPIFGGTEAVEPRAPGSPGADPLLKQLAFLERRVQALEARAAKSEEDAKEGLLRTGNSPASQTNVSSRIVGEPSDLGFEGCHALLQGDRSQPRETRNPARATDTHPNGLRVHSQSASVADINPKKMN